jgi:hypothetical protein
MRSQIDGKLSVHFHSGKANSFALENSPLTPFESVTSLIKNKSSDFPTMPATLHTMVLRALGFIILLVILETAQCYLDSSGHVRRFPSTFSVEDKNWRRPEESQVRRVDFFDASHLDPALLWKFPITIAPSNTPRQPYTDTEKAWRTGIPKAFQVLPRRVDPKPFLADERTWRFPSRHQTSASNLENEVYSGADRTWRFPEASRVLHHSKPSEYGPNERAWRFPRESQLRQIDAFANYLDEERTWRFPSKEKALRSSDVNARYSELDRSWCFPDPTQVLCEPEDHPHKYTSQERTWRFPKTAQIRHAGIIGDYSNSDRTWRFPDKTVAPGNLQQNEEEMGGPRGKPDPSVVLLRFPDPSRVVLTHKPIALKAEAPDNWTWFPTG